MRDMNKGGEGESTIHLGERRSVCGRYEIQLNFGSEGAGGREIIM